MRKIILLITLFFISFSCDKDREEENTYSGNSFVSFENITSTSLSVPEDGGAYTVKVLISHEQSSDVSATLNVEVVSQGGVAYTTSANQVTIPAGQLSGNFTITPVNDNFNSTSTVIKLTIATVTPGIIVGLKEVGSYEKTITIVNDDCPTKFNNWFGSINVEDVGYSTIPGTGAANVSGSCDVLVVTTSTNLVGWTSGALNNVAHTFVFTPNAPNSTTGFVEIEDTKIGTANFNFGAGSEPGDVFYTSSFGTYDETTKTIELDYLLRVRRLSTGAMYNLNTWTGTNKIIKP